MRIKNLIALLTYADQLVTSFKVLPLNTTPAERDAARTRIQNLLNDAVADLAAIQQNATGVGNIEGL